MTHYGKYLFRYRGQLPLIIIIISVPIIATTSHHDTLNIEYRNTIQCCSILLSIFGLCFRYYTTGSTPEILQEEIGRNKLQTHSTQQEHIL